MVLEKTIRRLVEEYLGDSPESVRARVDRIEGLLRRLVELAEEEVELLRDIKKALHGGARRGRAQSHQ